MNPERWQRVKNLLARAVEIDPAERAAYLDDSCSGDVSLRQDVENLLLDYDAANSEFLDESDLAALASSALADHENLWIGRRVGPYQIVEQIGAGGMGEVYRAFRADDQYRKEVALKVVRAGGDSSFILSRFKTERQILATLDHPNIARLFDGGTTEEGVPYLVMELIEGQPITEYCDSHQLSLADRLALFLQVCAAVQYAHQRLIIHRDIKPGNILVTMEGVPKLLDFGIAKIVEVKPDSEISERTLTMFRLLTPQYASPEQVKGEPITTASDVYSLGVVLYELLSGCSPYPKLNSASQLAQFVCEGEPLKPSVALMEDAGRASTGTGAPGPQMANADKLARHLKGDLDNIALVALRKEPQRRYSSVEQFAEDIRRYLGNLPVVARKDTAGYRISKFLTRHKAGVAAVTAIAAILVLGFIVTVQEARIARRRFNDVRSLANSLIFDVHDSIKDLPGSTPAKKIIVERALWYLNVLAQESKGDLGLQRELASGYERLGSVQGDYLENNLGDNQGTLESYRKALELRKQIAASSPDWSDRLKMATGYRLVAHQLEGNGDHSEARDAIGRAIKISEALNNQKPNNLDILYELSFDYEVSAAVGYPGYPGDSVARERVLQDYRRALAVNEIAVRLNPDDVRTLYRYSVDLTDIGIILEASDAREALKYYERSLLIDQKVSQLSPDPRYQRSVAIDYGTIASVYDDLGDYPRAVENNMKDLEIYQDLVNKDAKNFLLRRGVAIAFMNTAASSVRTGQIALAMEYSNRGLEIMRELAATAPDKSYQQRKLAEMQVIRGIILTAANQPQAAIAEIEHARSIYESMYNAGASDQLKVAAADVKLGEAEAKAGHEQMAADHFQEALGIVRPMITKEPADLDGLYFAADAYSGLAELRMRAAQRPAETAEKRRADLTKAQAWFSDSLHTWQRIQHPYHTAPHSFQVGDPALVAKQLKMAEAAISATH
ncbi:MAG TPA: serine/threonine-protein kinase [Terriglobales bacterium]|nr:serine/threonine-protein kinase [Terriglobales bacterium]